MGSIKLTDATPGEYTVQVVRRRDDWEPRLERYVKRCLSRPFQWGEHDCGKFAIGAYHAITGIDVMKVDESLNYSDRREAVDLLRDEGGIERILLRWTRRIDEPTKGAVAIVKSGKDRLSLGVCMNRAIIVPQTVGLACLSLSKAKSLWGIPD